MRSQLVAGDPLREPRVSSVLYLMRADGRDIRPLRGSGFDFQPAWSPDGKWLAFVRRARATGRDSLFVMRPDGTGVRRVWRDTLDLGAPAWSPDGNEIGFWRGDYRGGGLYVVRPDGTGFRRLVARADFDSGPKWSPDGKRIVFALITIAYIANADGSNVRRLTDTDLSSTELAWSPDGRSIVFSSEVGLHVVSADETGIRQITRAPSEDERDADPVWSPAGRWIAFSGQRGHRHARIYRVAPDGRGLKRLTSAPRP
jgi:TolB protein